MTEPKHGVVDLDRDDIKRGLADGSILARRRARAARVRRRPHPRAISLPLSTFDPDELPAEPGRRVVFSCATGVRSVRAIELARGAGLDIDEHYRGGFKDWAPPGAGRADVIRPRSCRRVLA